MKILKIILKIIGFFFGGIAGLFLLAILALHVAKYFIYSDYYKIVKRDGRNPGLNSGYVSQGCTYNDDENYFVTVGYMKDGSVSRIYKYDPETKKSNYYELYSKGKPFYGHTGGIQYTKGDLYIANESDGIYKFPTSYLKNSDAIDIGSPIKVNNNSSFIFSDDKFIYVGEFGNFTTYPCHNDFSYNKIDHHSIVTKYAIDDFETPLAIYSIPNEIQGFAITNSGAIVLSRSYGVSDSNFFVYRGRDIIDTNHSYGGAKIYFLGEPTENIKAPAMSEDMDIKDNKIIYLAETACNKYIFGKFFFDFFIYSLDII